MAMEIIDDFDLDLEIMLRKAAVLTMTGLSQTVLYHVVRDGLFPEPFRIAKRSIAWKLSEVLHWIATRERVMP